MKEPKWIHIQSALTFHAKQIKEHGGKKGMRDRKLLESALARPQHLFHYKKPNLFDLAASYTLGIAKNHPFMDGNKRTAIVVAAVFLIINGYKITAPEPELVMAVISLAESELPESDFSTWLKNNSQKLNLTR